MGGRAEGSHPVLVLKNVFIFVFVDDRRDSIYPVGYGDLEAGGAHMVQFGCQCNFSRVLYEGRNVLRRY
jgi:hypothetical protein